MAGNFIAMVYAVLHDKGVNTKGMSTEEVVQKYEELTGKTGRYDVQTGQKESSDKKQLLSKKDYAIVCHARAEKIANSKSTVQKQDYVFTDKYFVLFTNKSIGDFDIKFVLDIEKEGERIERYLEALDD